MLTDSSDPGTEGAAARQVVDGDESARESASAVANTITDQKDDPESTVRTVVSFSPQQLQGYIHDDASSDIFYDAVCPIDTEPSGPSKGRRCRRCFRPRLTTMEFVYMSMVCFVVLLMNADQNLLAPSLSVVAEEFNMTDTERDLYLGGYLSIAFFVSGGISALIAGVLADITNRKYTFSVVVIIGEVSCFCTIFVTSFWGLFATRFATGFALGGSMPVLYSLIGDTFVDEWRGRATSILVLLSGAGVVVGQTLAALIAPHFGWRIPFAVVSVPALACMFFFIVFVKEPERGGAERALKNLTADPKNTDIGPVHYSETMTWAKLWLLFKTPTVTLLLLMGLPGALPWGFLLVYAQDFLMNDVGPTIPGGISSSQSLSVVLIFAISSGVGNLLGGWITDAIWRREMSFVPLYAGIATLISAVPMYLLANVKLSLAGYCLLVIPGGFFNAFGAIAKSAMLLNCTLPETRGTAFAMNALVDDLGRGLGSFIIALMVVGLGGRIPAFNVAFGGWILSGLFFIVTAFTLKKDVHAKNRKLVEAVIRQPAHTSVSSNTDSNFADPEGDETQVATV